MPLTLAAAMALEAFSVVASTGSAAPVSTLTVLMLLAVAYDSSEVADRAVGVLDGGGDAEEPFAAWPPGAGHDFVFGSCFQSAGAASERYLPRFWVVPDSSERWNAWIVVSGSLTPGFSLAIAGSFHLVIFESKILARVEASSTRPSTPSSL